MQMIRRGPLALLLMIVLSGCLASPSPTTVPTNSTVDTQIRTDLTGLTVNQHRIVGCSCCMRWAAYLRNAGAEVFTIPDPEINEYRTSVGVPVVGAACHTAMIDGYVVEGHVPVEAILKLLNERPDVAGLTAPGMPSGSPGMGGNPGTWITTEVHLINHDGTLTLFDY